MVDKIQSNNTVSVTTTTSRRISEATNFSSMLDDTMKTNSKLQATSLDSIFERASQKYNMPMNILKAVAKAESNFNPKAVSSSGARGVMQLMPATAASLGVSDSFDPEQNIMGGAKYLSQLYDKYKGDIKLTLAAYNAGMGNVSKYGGIPPFKETQNYVVKVMDFMGSNISVPNITVKEPTTTTNNNTANKTTNFQGVIQPREENNDDIYSYDDYIQLLNDLKELIKMFYYENKIYSNKINQ